MKEKIKDFWSKVEDWYWEVCDSFAFLAAVWAATVGVSVLIGKWMYKAFYLRPMQRELDQRFGSNSK